MTYDELHKEIKDEFKKLYGKDNIKLYQNKYFIPNSVIFSKRLGQAVIEYKLTDLDKIKDILFKYIKKCINTKFPKYTRTIEYYIYGQNGKDCRLADDYENYEVLDTEIETERQYKAKLI